MGRWGDGEWMLCFRMVVGGGVGGVVEVETGWGGGLVDGWMDGWMG